MKTASLIVFTLLAPLGISAQSARPISPLAPPLATLDPSTPAQQYRLGRLTVTGNVRTKLNVILLMIPLEEGDIFNQSRWDFGIDQLNRSGLFKPIQDSDVTMKLDPALGTVDVELRLTEADHRRIDFSGGGGSTGGASGSVDYSDINVTGRGDRLKARFTLGTREQNVAGTYTLALISPHRPMIDLSGYFMRSILVNASIAGGDREPLYLQNSEGASVGLQFALSRTRYAISAPTRAGVVYSFSSTAVSDQFSTSIINTTSSQDRIRTGSVAGFLVHDTLDREFDPQRGQRLFAGVELGTRALGGSLNSVRPFLDYRRFFALGGNVEDVTREHSAIGLRFRASHISSFGKRFDSTVLSTVGGIPVFHRFFSGGEEEIRGYDLNSISPLARVDRFVPSTSGDPTLVSTEVRPIGGDTEILFNAEYRVPLVWRLSAAAFFDIGTSFNVSRLEREEFVTTVPNVPLGMIEVTTVLNPDLEPEFKLPNYRYSMGGELRLPIPVLNIPMRLIFAYNPNAQTQPPATALIAPEKRFAFRIGFSRTL
jgi:outer membrane protein insertion porin family